MADQPSDVDQFLDAHDYSHHSRRAIRSDLLKFGEWFQRANAERFDACRVTIRDVADFRNHLRDVRRQSASTVNRSLVSIRRFLDHLVANGQLPSNPARSVKEMKRQAPAPKGLAVSQVRRIMREVELRQDRRAAAVIGLMLYAGMRVSEVVDLRIDDVTIQPRSGQATIRRGKGNKQRKVPLSVDARRLLTACLESRPPSASSCIFVGERGPMTADGVRFICDKYAAVTGVRFHPHLLRHTFAHRFLEQTQNDLVALAQILGHESLTTTAIYSQRSQADLQGRIDDLRYG